MSWTVLQMKPRIGGTDNPCVGKVLKVIPGWPGRATVRLWPNPRLHKFVVGPEPCCAACGYLRWRTEGEDGLEAERVGRRVEDPFWRTSWKRW